MKSLLKDISIVAAGQGAPQGDDKYCDEGIPFVKAGNLRELRAGKSIRDIQKVSQVVADEYKLKLFPKGTIVFAKSGMSCIKGYVYVLPQEAYVVNHLACIIPNDNISSYLKYYFEYHKPNELIKDAAYPSITLTDIKNMEVDVKTEFERNDIINQLSAIERVITLKKRELFKLDILIKSRFVEMFGDPYTNLKEWDECALSEKINVVGGYAFKSDQFDEERGIPVLRIGNINMGFFRPTNMVYWREDDDLERYAIYPGDLVMSLTGTVGKNDYGNVCILGDEYEKYYLNQRNAKLEIKEGIDKYFLSQLLKFESIKKKLTGINRGVRQANISNKDILGLIVPIPPMEIQSRFACFVEQIDKLKFIIVVQCCVNTIYTLLYKGSSKDLK